MVKTAGAQARLLAREDVLLAAGQRAADLLGALAVSGLRLAGMLAAGPAAQPGVGMRRRTGTPPAPAVTGRSLWRPNLVNASSVSEIGRWYRA
ncbi:MAG TPA: hypothetical protein VH307_05960 [Streptosporangiaceae bacterium]|nr:hypothetical protein [Streptosporangiaceae bacterium]